jgi:uncharacterized protein YbjT (DUF2867 family)
MHLVVGATGRLGGQIATLLLEGGERVRAAVRAESPARAHAPHTDPATLRALGAELVDVDLKRPEGFRAALRGVTTVISTASGTKRPPPDTQGAVDHEGTGALARAAADAGVRQFIYVSARGAAPGAPGVFGEKWLGEEAVRASGVPATIVRPPMFMQDWIGFVIGAQLQGGTRVQLVGDSSPTVTFVDEADVARLVVAIAREGDAIGETLEIASEAATHPDIVRRIGETIGAPLEVQRLPVGATVETVSDDIAPMLTGLLTMLAMMPSDERTTPETAARYGLRLGGIDDYLRGAFSG